VADNPAGEAGMCHVGMLGQNCNQLHVQIMVSSILSFASFTRIHALSAKSLICQVNDWRLVLVVRLYSADMCL
jgi:hypothetical protein